MCILADDGVVRVVVERRAREPRTSRWRSGRMAGTPALGQVRGLSTSS
jgi:hypothetical protein